MIEVGRLLRARGLKGEFVAEIYSNHPDRADRLHRVFLEKDALRREVEVEAVWYHDGRPVLKFAGIDSMSAAEVWSGAAMLVAEEEKELPEEGAYSHADLIGSRVVNDQGEIGVVRGVDEFGGPALLNVEGPGGREILIPFVLSICKQIDVAGKVIRVELPEGLLDA